MQKLHQPECPDRANTEAGGGWFKTGGPGKGRGRRGGAYLTTMCARRVCSTPACIHTWHAGEEKKSSEDRARADLQCQQLQQQVHALQTQLQGAQGQAAEAHRLRMDSSIAADRALEQACQKLSALEPELQSKISQAEKVCS